MHSVLPYTFLRLSLFESAKFTFQENNECKGKGWHTSMKPTHQSTATEQHKTPGQELFGNFITQYDDLTNRNSVACSSENADLLN